MLYTDRPTRQRKNLMGWQSVLVALAISLLLSTVTVGQSRVLRYMARQQSAVGSATQNESVSDIELGKPVEREIKEGAAHEYKIMLTAGQFLRVIVEQRGVDVVVALYGPDGKNLAEMDSPNGKQGLEPLSWIAETAGAYRLEVRSLERKAPTGRYEIKIVEQRMASEPDGNRVDAQSAFMQAMRLREQGTAESLQKAAKLYEKALSTGQKITKSNEIKAFS